MGKRADGRGQRADGGEKLVVYGRIEGERRRTNAE
jgi:hypothetical protein